MQSNNKFFPVIYFFYIFFLNESNAQTPIPNQIIESNQADSYFGWAATDAGDINGDGYGDVIVGAYNYDNGQSNEGVVFVYHGSPTGLSATPAAMLESNQVNANFGRSISGAGDVNNDGYDDIIVGAYLYDSGVGNEGRIYIYHGSATGINTTPDRIIDGNQSGGNLGSCVSKAGDLNNDGFDDVIASAWVYESGQFDEGRVYVYLGSATGIPATAIANMDGNQNWAHFGTSVANAGDVDGDGFDDIVVGFELFDNGQDDEGKLVFYYGAPTGINTTPAAQIESNQAFASLGYDVASAGDVNNDGFDDVIAGAYRYDNGQGDEGIAYIFHGSATGILTTPATLLECNLAVSYFGVSVRDAGDFNSDGFDDVIVGASLYSNGSPSEGGAFLFKGSASGIITTPYLVMESDQAISYMGSSVSNAGDVNNDGFNDILTGVDFYDNGQTNEGAIFVYHMCADSLYADLDGDGFGDPLNKINICNEVINMVADNTDCDDSNANIFPGSTEICNSIDDDCNTLVDDGLVFYTFFADVDGDLHGDINDPGIYTCEIIAGSVLNNTDCDDTNNLINPDQIESCNTLDDDCSGIADDGLIFNTYYTDADADLFGDIADTGIYACEILPGTSTDNTDCNDTNDQINPGMPEICNLIDDNCSGVADEDIIITITIAASGATTFCQGSNVVLSATHNGTTLQWKKNGTNIPGATGLNYTATTSGNYTCVTTSLCGITTSNTLLVIANKNPNALITADGPTIFCAGEDVILSEIPVGGCAYQWYKGNNPIAGATSVNYTATVTGNYKCRVTKIATGCFKNSNVIPVSVVCKEGEIMGSKDISIYPNPTTGYITIETNNDHEKIICLYNSIGQIIFTTTKKDNIISLDLHDHSAGIYFIKVEGKDGMFMEKVVKE